MPQCLCGERGCLWALAKLEPQPEPYSLGLIREAISKRYGTLDLLDGLSKQIASSVLRAFDPARRRCMRNLPAIYLGAAMRFLPFMVAE